MTICRWPIPFVEIVNNLIYKICYGLCFFKIKSSYNKVLEDIIPAGVSLPCLNHPETLVSKLVYREIEPDS